MNYFQLNALYNLGNVIFALVFLAFYYVTLAQAWRKRLTRYLRWLLPFALANTVGFLLLLWQAWAFFAGLPATAFSGYVFFVLTFGMETVSILGVKRLLEMVRSEPGKAAKDGLETESDFWPPDDHSP
jgi:hypothetical protein